MLSEEVSTCDRIDPGTTGPEQSSSTNNAIGAGTESQRDREWEGERDLDRTHQLRDLREEHWDKEWG